MNKEKLCIYHGNCADGFTSAWVLWKVHPDTEFVAGIYGEDPPDCTDREVVMVDFSYKRDVILDMADKAKSILILDHHKSAEKELVDLPDNVECHFDMERSGARMTWDYYHGTDAPMFVKFVEDRDLWRFNYPETRAFQANVFSYEYTFENWEKIFKASGNEVDLLSFVAEGEAIERKHHKDINELIESAADRDVIAGHDVPVLNCPYFFSSDAGHIMSKNEPFAACYWDTPSGRVYSLRSADDGMDVSEIAASMGGGGHKNAAGYKVIK